MAMKPIALEGIQPATPKPAPVASTYWPAKNSAYGQIQTPICHLPSPALYHSARPFLGSGQRTHRHPKAEVA